MPDFRHRAIRHHSEGIFECMTVFGTTIELSTCVKCGKAKDDQASGHGDPGWRESTFPHAFKPKLIPVRWVAERHVQEDLGHIPTAADWLRRLTAESWMNRSRKLSRELEREEEEVQ